MYKAIVSDLDETLIQSNGQVSQKNIHAIQEARAKGVLFVPATGRSFRDFQHILKLLNVDNKEKEYAISYNGGVITENKQNRLLHSTRLPFELANEIFQIGVKRNVLIHMFTLDNIHTYQMNQNERNYLDPRMVVKEISTPSVAFLCEQPIMKINFQSTDSMLLQDIEQSLSTDLKEQLDINYSSNRYIEFNPKGVNKGNALQLLTTNLGIAPNEIIAVGDNMNDRTMIRYAGKGVAVSNAIEELKNAADYICRASHDENALAEVINTFIL